MIEQGFLLTSRFDDDSSSIIFWAIGADGPFKLVFTDQRFVLFILHSQEDIKTSISYERKAVQLKNFSENNVNAVYVKSKIDFYRLKQDLSDNGTRTFENDILADNRFLMERFLHGGVEVKGEFDKRDGIKTYMNPQIMASSYTASLSYVSLDIETGVNGELFSIGVAYRGKEHFDHVYMLGKCDTPLSNEVTLYENEIKLIQSFLNDFHIKDPDAIIGWHVIGFDLKFLSEKCQKLNIKFPLGRGKRNINLFERKNGSHSIKIEGRIVIDGPPTLRSAFLSFENYKLDTVAKEVLGIGKDIESNEDKVSEIERRFREDKLALAKYNLLDCTLVIDIYEKLNIIPFCIKRIQITGLLFDRLSSSTGAFDHQILPLLHRKGYVAPNIHDLEREDASSGGMVIEPIVGLHQNVIVLDFKSLYPSIIKTFKVDPYSRIKSAQNPLHNPSGVIFSKTEHLLPAIIEKLLLERAKAKKVDDHSLSMAIKILMNSFYGVMGSFRCRFYHSDLPKAITETGHWILKESISYLETQGFKVLYGDTDSLFIQLLSSDISGNSIALDLNLYLKDIIQEKFETESFLDVEYEKIFSKIFFTPTRSGQNGAKKRYVGISSGELSFTGMEYVRSDWTKIAKEFQYKIFEKYFNGEELEPFIKNFILNLRNGFYDDQLMYKKRLSKDPKEYTKNIPPHVRAALQIEHRGPYRLKEVEYFITLDGPRPKGKNLSRLDYEHYIDKQIKPIADQILMTMDKSFESVVNGSQLSLF